MELKLLSPKEFEEFENNHELANYYQTINYAMLMAENGFDYDLIGLVDNDNNILCASLILLKNVNNKYSYGYAPRGFLIDYHDKELLKIFTNKLKEYYYKRYITFIKVNPNIRIGEIDNNYNIKYNEFSNLYLYLKELGYNKLKSNYYFEAMLPRFNAIVDLNKYNSKELDKNTKNKIKKGLRKGLVFEKVDKDKMNIFYYFIKNKREKNENYYKDYYTVFEKNDSIDLFLVNINYNDYLKNSKYVYELEEEKNNHLNTKMYDNNNERLINNKMNSDKKLLTYKNDILEATKGLQDNKEVYIAGALVIKHNNTVSILFSGYDTNYKRFAPNYFLHYSILEYYKDNYDYLDLNGIVGDFTNENQYSGLNRFKIGFKPNMYEYIGEFDLVIEEKGYHNLIRSGELAKEFNKK